MNDLRTANKLIRQAQREADLRLHFHPIPLDRLTIGAFGDAAWAVRPDGSSQGGYIMYASSKELMDGKEAPLNILDWKSWKLKRKVSQLSRKQWPMSWMF